MQIFKLCFILLIPKVSTKHNASFHDQKRFLFDGKPLELPKTSTPYRSTGSLTFANRNFYLGGKQLRILSGSFHYFRAVPEYWRDIMLKMKTCGLNTVQTYVPWNLHEEYPGNFNFKGILNVRKFIQTAKEVGLYVIFRPGPYICAEWDFGGLPAWLLKDKSMKIRSNYPGYTQPVERYFTRLLQEVVDLQYSRGGPIIAVQVENEFGSYSNETDHLLFLKKLLQKNGIDELLFTSDGFYNRTHTGMDRSPFYTEALPTANFEDMEQGYSLFNRIGNLSTDFPLMVTEFWSGWFDQWRGGHHTVSSQKFGSTLRNILEAGASVNFYMFYGGTSFGFMSGANWESKTMSYFSDITSYDYDAPLNEAGDVTLKYNVTRDLIKTYALTAKDGALATALPDSMKCQSFQVYSLTCRNYNISDVSDDCDLSSLPDPPADFSKEGYGILRINSYLDWNSMKQEAGVIVNLTHPIPMEFLPLRSGRYGQNFGLTLYTTQFTNGSILKFSTLPKDRAEVFVDGKIVSVIESWSTALTITLPNLQQQNTHILEILVENIGRVNFITMGSNILNEQRKGILSDVLLDNHVLQQWSIHSFDFSSSYINKVRSLPTWRNITARIKQPGMYRATLHIQNEPKDTFLWMKEWSKGIVFINGFNLGRYWDYGPQQTLYVPAPLLHRGKNEGVDIASVKRNCGSLEYYQLLHREEKLGLLNPSSIFLHKGALIRIVEISSHGRVGNTMLIFELRSNGQAIIFRDTPILYM